MSQLVPKLGGIFPKLLNCTGSFGTSGDNIVHHAKYTSQNPFGTKVWWDKNPKIPKPFWDMFYTVLDSIKGTCPKTKWGHIEVEFSVRPPLDEFSQNLFGTCFTPSSTAFVPGEWCF